MNYDLMLRDIEDFHMDYPDASQPEIASRFKTLDEYWTIAKKIISTFAPQFIPASEVQKMVNSDQAVSEIARKIMMADWSYKENKGRTPYSHRNQRGKWAIQKLIKKILTHIH
jgi:hypothetical protein